MVLVVTEITKFAFPSVPGSPGAAPWLLDRGSSVLTTLIDDLGANMSPAKCRKRLKKQWAEHLQSRRQYEELLAAEPDAADDDGIDSDEA